MELDDLSDRVSDTVEGLRDRTAEAVRADGRSVFREVRKLGRHVEGTGEDVRRRVDDAETALQERIEVLDDRLSARIDKLVATRRRTTWPRRLLWIAVGIGAGASVAYLGDPDRGRARRARMGDQALARGRELGGQAVSRAKDVAGRTKGQVIERAKEVLPDDVPDDPALLEQRIKSEVFGHRPDTTRVVLRVDAPGVVALKGTVPSARSERELMHEVAQVDGVLEVASELTVRSA